MSKTAISLGVEAQNKQNQSVAEGRAITLIQNIKDLNTLQADNAEELKDLQEHLQKLQLTDITADKILGGSLPSESQQTPAQKTIAKVLGVLVEQEQQQVKTDAEETASCIATLQASMKQADKDIADLRKELAELTVEVVTEKSILGS